MENYLNYLLPNPISIYDMENKIKSFMNNKKKWQTFMKKHSISNDELSTIIFSQGNHKNSFAKYIKFKYHEKERKNTEEEYHILYDKIWSYAHLPTYRKIEILQQNNNTLLKYYKLEFETYNEYLSTLYSNTICTICHEVVDYSTSFLKKPNVYYVTLMCNHTFHINCLSPWLEKQISCPTCRDKIQNKSYVLNISDEELLTNDELINDM